MEAVAQEIIAWRGWHLVRDEQGEWWLHSVSMGTRWEGPTFVADKVPTRDSPHGVYALCDRQHVQHQRYEGQCCGEVALSGVVVEGNTGYRAERATIRRLILLGYPQPDVRPIEVMAALEERYQCEVGWEEGVKDEWGSGNVYAQWAQQQLQAYAQQYSGTTQMSIGSLSYGLKGIGGMGGLGSI